jgi:hypothetical protein
MSKSWDLSRQDTGSDLSDLSSSDSESELATLFHEPEFQDLSCDDSASWFTDAGQLFEVVADSNVSMRTSSVDPQRPPQLTSQDVRNLSNKSDYSQSHGLYTGSIASSASASLKVPEGSGFGNLGSLPQNRMVSTSTVLATYDMHGRKASSISIRAGVNDVNVKFYDELAKTSPAANVSTSAELYAADVNWGTDHGLPQIDVAEDVSVAVDTDIATSYDARTNTTTKRRRTPKKVRDRDAPSKRQCLPSTCPLGQDRRQQFENAVDEFIVKMSGNQAATLDIQRYYTDKYNRLLKTMPRPQKEKTTSEVKSRNAKGRHRKKGRFISENLTPITECDNASIQEI